MKMFIEDSPVIGPLVKSFLVMQFLSLSYQVIRIADDIHKFPMFYCIKQITNWKILSKYSVQIKVIYRILLFTFLFVEVSLTRVCCNIVSILREIVTFLFERNYSIFRNIYMNDVFFILTKIYGIIKMKKMSTFHSSRPGRSDVLHVLKHPLKHHSPISSCLYAGA